MMKILRSIADFIAENPILGASSVVFIAALICSGLNQTIWAATLLAIGVVLVVAQVISSR